MSKTTGLVLLLSTTLLLSLCGPGALPFQASEAGSHAPRSRPQGRDAQEPGEPPVPPKGYRTAKISRGNLTVTVRATGTLQPTEVIDIGAQVNGLIAALGKDPADPTKIVDWGTEVEQGTVLAQIDKGLYQAQFKATSAEVKLAEAELLVKKAHLKQARIDWERARELHKQKAIAQAEYNQAESTHEIAQANVAVAEAQVERARAARELAQMNLDYTTIKSPTKGIIIDRRVNVGQTVVASLSAPSIFLIAKDLGRMEVWATVSEIDAPKVKIGQDVTFTVDAYPGEVFKGKVKPQGKYATRLNAALNQNVVTYTVVVSAENPPQGKEAAGKLLPYLTAEVKFTVAEKKDVLLVPNAAFRWKDAFAKVPSTQGVVYVLGKDRKPQPVTVRLGLNDSTHTEIVAPIPAELKEGAEVIISTGSLPSAEKENPFIPKLPK